MIFPLPLDGLGIIFLYYVCIILVLPLVKVASISNNMAYLSKKFVLYSSQKTIKGPENNYIHLNYSKLHSLIIHVKWSHRKGLEVCLITFERGNPYGQQNILLHLKRMQLRHLLYANIFIKACTQEVKKLFLAINGHCVLDWKNIDFIAVHSKGHLDIN